MYSDLAIRDHPLIRECFFEALPSPVVVCGPNSSGKSTVLEALVDPEVTCAAITMGRHLDAVERALLPILPWAGRPQYADAHESVLRGVLADRPAWIANDAGTFATIFQQHQGKNRQLGRGARPRPQDLDKAFRTLFPPHPSSVVLPPKRQLEVTPAVQVQQPIRPDGSGVTNALFAAQNQVEGSAGDELLGRVRASFADITEGHRFQISLEGENRLRVNFQPPGRSDWLSAERCGLGLQDVLVILWFALAPDHTAVAIEEPESHLHPGWQRRLLAFLRSVEDKRFLVSTHSNVFLDNALVDRVLMTRLDEGKITIQDVTSRASMLDDLGYSVADNLVSDMVVLVEGPSDPPVLEELLIKRGVFGKYMVRFWPMGGDIMDQLDLGVFAEAHRICALIDQDIGSRKVRERFIRKCNDAGIPVHRLEKRALENYFSVSALRAVFGAQVPDSLDRVRPDQKLETQLGFNVKKRNRAIARAMDWNHVAETDLGGFILDLERTVSSV